MWRVILFICIASTARGQNRYCCTPDQWQGNVGELVGTVASGSPHLAIGNVSMSYDYTNKMLETSSYLMVDGKPQIIRVISNYQTGKMYVISGSECTVNSISGEMQRLCIPDNAVSAGQITYGVGASSLAANAYLIQAGAGTTVFVTTTVGNPCAPIAELEYGIPNQVPTIQTLGYFDITPGIANPAIFVPPSSCNGQSSLTFAPKLDNTLMEYIHSKVKK